MVVFCEYPIRSAVSKKLRPARRAPTTMPCNYATMPGSELPLFPYYDTHTDRLDHVYLQHISNALSCRH